MGGRESTAQLVAQMISVRTGLLTNCSGWLKFGVVTCKWVTDEGMLSSLCENATRRWVRRRWVSELGSWSSGLSNSMLDKVSLVRPCGSEVRVPCHAPDMCKSRSVFGRFAKLGENCPLTPATVKVTRGSAEKSSVSGPPEMCNQVSFGGRGHSKLFTSLKWLNLVREEGSLLIGT